jgi:hypothetical protein
VLAYQNLIEEILDELLLQRAGGEQSVQVSPEELGDEVSVQLSKSAATDVRVLHSHVFEGRDEDVAERNDLRLSMLCFVICAISSHILMTEMLQ